MHTYHPRSTAIYAQCVWDKNQRQHWYWYTLAPFILPRNFILAWPWLPILSHRNALYTKDGVAFLGYSHRGKLRSSSAETPGVPLGLSLHSWDQTRKQSQLLMPTIAPNTAPNATQTSPDHSFTFVTAKIIFFLVIFCSFQICKRQYTHGRSNPHLLPVPGLICIHWGVKTDTTKF